VRKVSWGGLMCHTHQYTQLGYLQFAYRGYGVKMKVTSLCLVWAFDWLDLQTSFL